ncbi:MAG TPA: hypothetical protein VHY37_09075, partial [Tepidisphaeraceae bacterium]|nr:hypothetical protein [Tepidisphaeraceae bacterium]
RLDNLVAFIKRIVDKLPPSLRLASFAIGRGAARMVVPRYRRTARAYAAAGDGNSTVSGGPFRGLRYISCAAGSTTMPKLLGTYELELHPAIASLLEIQPDLVVDVGSAEGYYAVGLAVRLPQAKVVCYDIDPFARYLLHRLCRRNGVLGRVKQKHAFDPGDLEEVLAGALQPALIMDVDGPEDQFLAVDRAPSLKRASIIVELHDFLNPGVSERISERFKATHDIAMIESRPRNFSDLPPGLKLSETEALDAMDEARGGPQQWFVMTPKLK